MKTHPIERARVYAQAPSVASTRRTDSRGGRKARPRFGKSAQERARRALEANA